MIITGQQLKHIVPNANQFAIDTYPPLYNEILPRYLINTPARIQAYIAETAHETGSYKFLREIASGQAYEGRKDLGNTVTGDGKKFKGRGHIMVTGRANYLACSMDLFGDNRLILNPEILATPRYAVESSCWFWQKHNLNAICDMPETWVKVVTKKDGTVVKYTKFQWITRIINGGLTNYEDRLQFYNRAKEVIK